MINIFGDYIYAVISAIFWATSASIIGAGLSDNFKDKDKVYIKVLLAITIASTSGALTLIFVLIFLNIEFSAEFNYWIILAGVFTYPIATGLYYLSSTKLGNQAEIVSLFVKAKPLFSIPIAFLLFQETILFHSVLALALIGIGIYFLIKGVREQQYTIYGVLYGLATSLSWATGEFFVKAGFNQSEAIQQSLYALICGIVFCSIFLIAYSSAKNIKTTKIKLNSYWAFALHGMLSFGIAYTSFFYSITTIGIVRSLLATAFWPILALIISSIANKLAKNQKTISKEIWVAGIILCCASTIEILQISID